LKFSWALIGRCKSESFRVFQRIFAENNAGSPTVCAGSNRSKSKVVFNLSALKTLSYERCNVLCDLKEKNMLSRENVQFACGFGGLGNIFQ